MATDQFQNMQEGQLYIAMAGQHQIWRHDVALGVTSAFSGDGSERNANGRNGGSTSWAQPSGLALSRDGADLWVADSESSTVRSMRLATGGSQVSPDSPSIQMCHCPLWLHLWSASVNCCEQNRAQHELGNGGSQASHDTRSVFWCLQWILTEGENPHGSVASAIERMIQMGCRAAVIGCLWQALTVACSA